MNCPYCRSYHDVEVELVFKNPPNITNQTVDKWDLGGYYCLECGLAGPKNLIENLDVMLEQWRGEFGNP